MTTPAMIRAMRKNVDAAAELDADTNVILVAVSRLATASSSEAQRIQSATKKSQGKLNPSIRNDGNRNADIEVTQLKKSKSDHSE